MEGRRKLKSERGNEGGMLLEEEGRRKKKSNKIIKIMIKVTMVCTV